MPAAKKKIDAFLYRHRYEENDQANLALYCLASLIAVQECQDPNQMLGIVNPRKVPIFGCVSGNQHVGVGACFTELFIRLGVL